MGSQGMGCVGCIGRTVVKITHKDGCHERFENLFQLKCVRSVVSHGRDSKEN